MTQTATIPAKKLYTKADLVLTKNTDGSVVGNDGNTYTIGEDKEHMGILKQSFLIANNSGFGLLEWQALPTAVQNPFR